MLKWSNNFIWMWSLWTHYFPRMFYCHSYVLSKCIYAHTDKEHSNALVQWKTREKFNFWENLQIRITLGGSLSQSFINNGGKSYVILIPCCTGKPIIILWWSDRIHGLSFIILLKLLEREKKIQEWIMHNMLVAGLYLHKYSVGSSHVYCAS